MCGPIAMDVHICKVDTWFPWIEYERSMDTLVKESP